MKKYLEKNIDSLAIKAIYQYTRKEDKLSQFEERPYYIHNGEIIFTKTNQIKELSKCFGPDIEHYSLNFDLKCAKEYAESKFNNNTDKGIGRFEAIKDTSEYFADIELKGINEELING